MPAVTPSDGDGLALGDGLSLGDGLPLGEALPLGDGRVPGEPLIDAEGDGEPTRGEAIGEALGTDPEADGAADGRDRDADGEASTLALGDGLALGDADETATAVGRVGAGVRWPVTRSSSGISVPAMTAIPSAATAATSIHDAPRRVRAGAELGIGWPGGVGNAGGGGAG
jgi:hypothetical protein